MSELELFPERAGGPEPDDAPSPGSGPGAPLAARMRPRSLEEFEGQEHLLAPGKPLRAMLAGDRLSSMIFWGPPGSGKTTLARLLADASDAAFVPFSAVSEGIPRVREIIAEARQRTKASGRRTILFCDEIHRFNKAQQDAFLPHVEEGVVTLIGATTENPSFEIIRPLLSRAPVLVLEPLSPASLARIVERAAGDPERGLGGRDLELAEGVADFFARTADGDARRALGLLETAAELVDDGDVITEEVAREALQHRHAVYDKGGEEHYNLISALHKAVRGSDPDGALYWLARMLEAGEDPRYVARRLVRMASEDIGMADPEGLRVAVTARDAYHFLGSPEGELALAQATVYLATAPKSNRVYRAWKKARDAARDTPGEPVSLHIRNAPTDLMKELGYGEGYRYDHDEAHGVAPQRYLPEVLEDAVFYEPGPLGFETEVRERLEWWAARRAEARERLREEEGEESGTGGAGDRHDPGDGGPGADPSGGFGG